MMEDDLNYLALLAGVNPCAVGLVAIVAVELLTGLIEMAVIAVIAAAAAAAVVPVVAIGKMNGAATSVVGIAAAAAAVAAVTARNSSPRTGTGSSSVGRASSPPFRNTTSMSGSEAARNCRPSPTSYRPRVQASTDSRLNPCGIPCSRHHPPVCVFLPSPADPSLHNSENIQIANVRT